MARTLNPLSSEKASGSFGRVITFKPRRTATVVARKSQPSQPRTADQLARRAAFSAVTKAWAALTPSQVTAWEDYAAANPVTDRLGGSVALPGYDAFVKCSLAYRFQYGSNPASPLPANHGLDISALTGGPAFSGNLLIGWTWPSGAGGGWLVGVWLQGPLANGNRALRQPEQRFNQYAIHPTAGVAITGLTVGDWYYIGAGLSAPGVYPRPVHWLGPFQII